MIGAEGRDVEDPTVVPGAVLSATRGPLQGAHINKTANTATAAISMIHPEPMPAGSAVLRSSRYRGSRGFSRFGSSLFWHSSQTPGRKPLQNPIVPIVRCARMERDRARPASNDASCDLSYDFAASKPDSCSTREKPGSTGRTRDAISSITVTTLPVPRLRGLAAIVARGRQRRLH